MGHFKIISILLREIERRMNVKLKIGTATLRLKLSIISHGATVKVEPMEFK